MQTVQEVRAWGDRQDLRTMRYIDSLSDQRIRELIQQAEEQGTTVENYILWILMKKATPRELPCEKQPPKRPTPRKRKVEGCVTVGGVLLTPKQLEFMERLSEIPKWQEKGIDGEYAVFEYAAELSDSYTPISVGAIVTTLREKNLISTRKGTVDGVRGCLFTLTDLGKTAYKGLQEGKYE